MSVYADPFNKVLKGSKTDHLAKGEFLKDKIFVGNGISSLGRDEVFKMSESKNFGQEKSDRLAHFCFEIQLTI